MNLVIVKFLPKVEGKTFDLQLNKKMSYDQVSNSENTSTTVIYSLTREIDSTESRKSPRCPRDAPSFYNNEPPYWWPPAARKKE